jgi:hypothetical protein
MIDQHEILWGVLAPPVLMAIGMAATAWLPATRRFLSTGALLALVFGICQLGFRHWPLPGSDVHNWPAWIAFTGGLITLCSACGHGPLAWRILVRVAITGVASWLLLGLELRDASVGTTALWIAVSTASWSALLLIGERIHATATPGVSVTVLATWAALSAAALLLFNTMNHAQFAGILTAALTAAAVLSWWRPAWYAASGPATVTLLILPALWLLGTYAVHTGLPVWALPFLAAAGLAPWLITTTPARDWSPWKRLVLANAITALLLLPVVVPGVVGSIKAAAEPSYGY